MIALLRQSDCLSIALNERDAYTHGHCERVVRWSLAIARRCALESRELDVVGAAAQLHDIGKIGIPDRVLLKAGALDPEEWQVMRSHSELGQRICAAIPDPHFDEIGQLVRHHHEAVDGSGYPDGLRGEAIPVGARIIAVSDAYDAMVTARPYHPSRSHAEAMDLLEAESGHKLDPYLLAQFKAVLAGEPA